MPHAVTSRAEAKNRCSQTNQPIYKKNFWEPPHCPLTLSESHNGLWSSLVPRKSMHMPHPALTPSEVPVLQPAFPVKSRSVALHPALSTASKC